MSRLRVRLPDLGDEYNPTRARELVRHLENLFGRIEVTEMRGAYSVTANTTLDEFDDLVETDTSGGDVTITLPEISDQMVRDKREYEVVHSAVSGTTTVLPTSTDTILGEPDAVFTIQWTAIRFRATTGNWIAI